MRLVIKGFIAVLLAALLFSISETPLPLRCADSSNKFETYNLNFSTADNGVGYVNVLIPPDAQVTSFVMSNHTGQYRLDYQYVGCFSLRCYKFARANINLTDLNLTDSVNVDINVTVTRNAYSYIPCYSDELADTLIQRLQIDEFAGNTWPHSVFLNLNNADNWRGYPILTVQKEAGYTLPNDSDDYVLITSNELQPAAANFLNAKNQQGLRTFLMTTEEIGKEYFGSSLQYQTLEFLKDAFNTWHMKYVLIVGNSGVLPPFDYIVSNGVSEQLGEGYNETVGTDYPYMALEQNPENLSYQFPYAPVTDFPDFVLGRFPLDNIAQTECLMNKTLSYEGVSNPEPSARNLLVVVGGGNQGEPNETSLVLSRVNYFDDIANPRVVSYLGWGTNLTARSITNCLDEGYGAVDFICHASPSYWQLGLTTESGVGFGVSDVSMLSNSKPTIVFSEGCNTGRFYVGNGSLSVAAQMLGNPGDAVAIVGSTYYAGRASEVLRSTYNMGRFNIGISHEWLPNANYNLGVAFYYVRAFNAGWECNELLGDPSLVLATSKLDPIISPLAGAPFLSPTPVPTVTSNWTIAPSSSPSFMNTVQTSNYSTELIATLITVGIAILGIGILVKYQKSKR